MKTIKLELKIFVNNKIDFVGLSIKYKKNGNQAPIPEFCR